MNSNIFMENAKECVIKTEFTEAFLQVEDLYIVWFSKTLQNWKALISTDKVSGYYWEVTHNGTKNETYVDEYVKKNNNCVRSGLLGC